MVKNKVARLKLKVALAKMVTTKVTPEVAFSEIVKTKVAAAGLSSLFAALGFASVLHRSPASPIRLEP